MLVVVRCPGCRGASRVGPEALGLMVVCPRCQDQFLAVEEAAPVAPARPKRNPTTAPAPAPSAARGPTQPPNGWAEPVAPPADPAAPPRRRRRRKPGEPEAPAAPAHDPHDPSHHAGGLPASVLIGLALLPFAIPLLWLIAPVVMGQPPVLTLAAPAALAVAASALSLAVIYTVDWSPATRVKGVLMLVGLAYFAGLSLYFLKKDMLDRVKQTFGPERQWKEFTPPAKAFRVKMPGNPAPANEQPVPGCRLETFRASEKKLQGAFVYVAGAGKLADPDADEAEWFENVGRAVFRQAGEKAPPPERLAGSPLNDQPFPGRAWELPLGDGLAVRYVRVYRDKEAGRVFYLSAEGPGMTPDDADALFASFIPAANKPKD